MTITPHTDPCAVCQQPTDGWRLDTAHLHVNGRGIECGLTFMFPYDQQRPDLCADCWHAIARTLQRRAYRKATA